MKTISITANNITINPYGSYKIDASVELDEGEYDSLIYDLESERIVTTKGVTELLRHMSDNDIIDYLKSMGYKVI